VPPDVLKRKQVFTKMYPDSYILQVPPREPHPTAYIIDGMFIINIIPLSIHKSFSDYASFLFDKWIVRPHHQFKSSPPAITKKTF
jgi:hypothetical protein